jgi:hypothetical protein
MVVLTGAMLHFPLIGVAGFAMTLTGLVIASTGSLASASSKSQESKASGNSRSGKGARGGFMEFFENRWDDRMNGQ